MLDEMSRELQERNSSEIPIPKLEGSWLRTLYRDNHVTQRYTQPLSSKPEGWDGRSSLIRC